MNRVILHIDFNSYFATVEQQANPRLRGKPIGVTGGDRLTRTVLSTASIEAKKLGVKTGMQLWEAKKICPEIIILAGDSDKYLACTTRFLNILKDYSPFLEIFSIDESFLELQNVNFSAALQIAQDIKHKIRQKVGEYMSCSIGISYNKRMAKLASSLQKPDGLVLIEDQAAAIKILDNLELDEICGIGYRIKKRLINMGITNFYKLRQVPKDLLMASFKSYGEALYNMARGIDETPVLSFWQKEGVKSIGQRHTLDSDTSDLLKVKQILLKISEMISNRLRGKQLVCKTVQVYYRKSFDLYDLEKFPSGGGAQKGLGVFSDNGLEIYQNALEILNKIWHGEKIRMIGVTVSNLKKSSASSLRLDLEEVRQKEILKVMDYVNKKFGEWTIQRASLLGSELSSRKPNPYLSDRRFKL